MSVAFRNVDAHPDDPVDTWPYEAIVTVIERGTIGDWLRLTRAIDADPWGVVARQVEEYLGYEAPYGVGPLLERAIARARRQAEESERAEVAREVALLIERSGLTAAELAHRVGTSRSRLSTYRSGSVVPSAAMLVRLRRAVERAALDRGSR
ncbi:helix-turn-helix domain-containing protein [Janibacter indicus]|uniref:helix-turn-helix domain-containing protein n=1 Tax=Janibacter indicus TaxID=857417 RepID=UPI003EB9E605